MDNTPMGVAPTPRFLSLQSKLITANTLIEDAGLGLNLFECLHKGTRNSDPLREIKTQSVLAFMELIEEYLHDLITDDPTLLSDNNSSFNRILEIIGSVQPDIITANDWEAELGTRNYERLLSDGYIRLYELDMGTILGKKLIHSLHKHTKFTRSLVNFNFPNENPHDKIESMFPELRKRINTLEPERLEMLKNICNNLSPEDDRFVTQDMGLLNFYISDLSH